MERDRLTPTDYELDETMTTAMDGVLAAALDDFPVTPLPLRFVPATMQRISPRFQLQFLDLALPFLSGVLFLTLLVGLGWFADLINLPWLPDPAGFLPETLTTWDQLPVNFLLFITIAVGAALVMVGTVYIALWLDRPLYVQVTAHQPNHGRM